MLSKYFVSKKITAVSFFAISVVLGVSIFTLPGKAMEEDSDGSVGPSKNAIAVRSNFEAWILTSRKLTEVNDVVNLSRVCKLTREVTQNYLAWEGVAFNYQIIPGQIFDVLARVKGLKEEQGLSRNPITEKIYVRKHTKDLSSSLKNLDKNYIKDHAVYILNASSLISGESPEDGECSYFLPFVYAKLMVENGLPSEKENVTKQ